MTVETFGQRLQRLRNRARLSTDELAAAIEVTVQTVRLWERGAARPRAVQFPQLASALGVTTYYLRHGRELSDVRLAEIERRMRLALHAEAMRRAS